MNTITPVPIFINSSEENERCPKCGKPEEIVEVCKHCGHEYEYEEDIGIIAKIISIAILIFVLIFIAWFLLTLLFWLVEGGSLEEILRGQWEYLSRMSILEGEPK